MKVLVDFTVKCSSCNKGVGHVKNDIILAEPGGDWLEILFTCPKCKSNTRFKYKLDSITLDRTNAPEFTINLDDYVSKNVKSAHE